MGTCELSHDDGMAHEADAVVFPQREHRGRVTKLCREHVEALREEYEGVFSLVVEWSDGSKSMIEPH